MADHSLRQDVTNTLRRRPGRIAVLRFPPDVPVPPLGPASGATLEAVIRTPEETSLVRDWEDPAVAARPDTARSGPYLAWSVPGKLDFELVGVLLELIRPLRAAGVPVLAISTFDTDWLLVDEARGPVAEAAWRSAGIEILDDDPVGPADPPVRERRDGDL
ncbi:MAG: ACT domain-containing protein [Phycisphaeraceae bacterium]|nr:ACT domain-containing protein [Phycisphaeraceae bacterium]|tara:strand:+ start:142 stop:624 length:483 start_codon:yes stop_codon:yes gene_type:complete